MWNKTLTKIFTGSLIGISLAIGNSSWGVAQSLEGAGASFPAPLYERYFSEYQQLTGVEVEYKSIGSGGGIERFINQLVDFGASDVVPNSTEINQMEKGLLMIPTGGGAVAVIYNLRGETVEVRLSRQKLAQIFTGEITNWKQVSPRLPNLDVRVIVRSDSSGTTALFTSYLEAITEGEFKSSRQPDWGSFIFDQAPQNSGVAALVKQTEGAIGYVQASFAIKNNLSVARIENQGGKYVEPTLEEANKGIANIEFQDDLTINRTNDPPEGYPIVGITWLLIYQQYESQEKLEAIKNLLTWILEEGQELNEAEGYTRIPPAIAQQALTLIQENLTLN